MPADWSHTEVELIVADYFAMLGDELAGRPYSKAEHRRRLAPCTVRRRAARAVRLRASVPEP